MSPFAMALVINALIAAKASDVLDRATMMQK
jgi:hypothetical protein